MKREITDGFIPTVLGSDEDSEAGARLRMGALGEVTAVLLGGHGPPRGVGSAALDVEDADGLVVRAGHQKFPRRVKVKRVDGRLVQLEDAAHFHLPHRLLVQSHSLRASSFALIQRTHHPLGSQPPFANELDSRDLFLLFLADFFVQSPLPKSSQPTFAD